MTDIVNHPPHYTQGFAGRPIECIDITQHMSFCDGNAFKYIWRAGKKGDRKKMIEDLEKAEWYLDRICENYGTLATGNRFAARGVFSLIVSPGSAPGSRGLTEPARYHLLADIVEWNFEQARIDLVTLIAQEKAKDESGVL